MDFNSPQSYGFVCHRRCEDSEPGAVGAPEWPTPPVESMPDARSRPGVFCKHAGMDAPTDRHQIDKGCRVRCPSVIGESDFAVSDIRSLVGRVASKI